MKKAHLPQVYIYFISILIFILHLPMLFAKSLNGSFNFDNSGKNYSSDKLAGDSLTSSAMMLNDSLKLNVKGLSRNAYNYAIEGLDKLMASGRIQKKDIVSIVDFRRPSIEKRFFVIDLNHRKLLFNTYVAHGHGSGKYFARQFSNNPSSFQSSLGFYETSSTYNGKHGFSLKLAGLENGINDKVEERAIVMHAASYVSESYIHATGCLGRSQGCPALPEKISKPIIEKIKNGTCLFIYGPDNKYLRRSHLLNS